MAIPSSGEIKMGGTGTNSIAQVKAGTDTGTPSAVQNVSLRGLSVDGVNDFQYTGGAYVDLPVSGSSPDQVAPHSMSEFHGYVNSSFDDWPTSGLITTPDSQWGQKSHNDPSTVQVGCNYGQFHDTTNDRIRHRWTTFDSSAASVYSYADQDYIGMDSAQFQAKADYTTTTIAGTNEAVFQNPASFSPASGVWTNTSTSTYSPVWQWTITINSGGSASSSISSGLGGVFFYNRATLNGVTYPSTSDGYDGNQYYRSDGNTISLTAARSQFAQPAGPGGGGLEP